MDAPAPNIGATTELPRAGFWRRWLSLIIDLVIVMLPFQMLAAGLFATTDGRIQMDSGFFTVCQGGKTIPEGLDPPPPHDSNVMRVCRVSFFGATTGAVLTVGRVTKEGTTTTSVSQGYMLDADGKPIKGTSIDGIVQLALLAYLVGMIWKTGRTLGARAVGVRVVDTSDPQRRGVPVLKAALRYLVMFLGAAPALALLAFQYETKGSSADAIFTAGFFQMFVIAGLVGAVWTVVLIVQIAWKTDPVYDRLAGTAVLKS
jgi:uncharacterized RDD family membrane protein YckC